MSEAQHEQMAKQEDTSATAHAAEFNPAAETKVSRCSGKQGCWTSVSNPTKEHDDDAQQHRELAAKHRAASAALAQAETQACTGISDDDRDISPFDHREDIESVSSIQEPIKHGKHETSKLAGATVVFRAGPGMTAEWLQRVVNCHLARAAATGHAMPEMDYCPLVLNGVSAKVASVGDGFAVSLTSEDTATAAEILKRSQALAPTATTGNAATPGNAAATVK
ncbi:MAG: hypothetical protein ABI627_29010 [Polyangiaceae bacterium]